MSGTNTTKVYIGLGSNLDDPQHQIQQALRALAALTGTKVLKDSGLYLSRPMVSMTGDQQQPDYYNAVVLIETELAPLELLEQLQQIEQAQGRVRTERWGPRTIDLDILLYGEQTMNHERLTLPHPGMHQREFVLYPLQRIDGALEIPGHGMLDELIKNCPDNGLKYLGAIEV